jgi:amidase
MAVTGPMARTVADVALMLATIAGPDPRVPLSYDVAADAFVGAVAHPSARGLRVAFTPDLGGLLPVDPEIAELARAASGVFGELGATVEDASPDLDGAREIIRATRGLSMVTAHEDRLHAHGDRLQAGLAWNVRDGLALTAPEIAAARRLRGALWARMSVFLDRYDLLVCPTTAVTPFPVDQPYPTAIGDLAMEDYTHWFRLTYAITLTTLPVLAMPAGFTRAGLPVGIQIVGRRRGEVAVLRAGAAYELATDHAARRPRMERSLDAPA